MWCVVGKSKTNNLKTRKCDREEYDRLFSVTLLILKIIGIRYTTNDKSCVSLFWRCFLWFLLANIFMALMLELAQIALTAATATLEGMVGIFRMVPCAGYTILGLTKSYNMVFNQSVYENLIVELARMWPSADLRADEAKVVTSTVRLLRLFIKGYFVCNGLTCLFFFGVCFTELFKHLLGQDVQLLLPFEYWLPFDPIQNGYTFILFMQVWHGTSVVIFVFGNDLLFCSFLSQISMQFDLLSSRIHRMFQVPCDQQLISSFPLGACGEKYFNVIGQHDTNSKEHEKLVGIIVRHRKLIQLSADVERLFSFPMLVNVVNSSMILCFCGFCCVIIEKWNEVAYKFFLAMALSQTWLLCFYGQRLVDSSEGVSRALYNSGWYQATTDVTKCIAFMMCRAQKQVNITTYGFSVMCLDSYSTIVKTAWSYFMLVLNVYKKD